ncbi:hypothetical protein Tco_1447671 [Tanacetum coccineum]
MTVEVRGLTTIDIEELVKLRICERFADVVTWVAMGPPREQVEAAGGATQVDLEGPEGAAMGQEDVQPGPTPQIPQAVALAHMTIPQRLQRLEEEVHRLHESLGEQRVLLEMMSGDHDRLSTWMVARMGQLMHQSGIRYSRFDGSIVGSSHVSYERRNV